jgi:hypothetical protein
MKKRSAVTPAKAGVHSRRDVFMDSGFRRNDERGRVNHFLFEERTRATTQSPGQGIASLRSQ